MVLSSESTAARMSRIGKAVLFETELLTLDEMISRVDAVGLDEVSELADELYAPEQLAAAAIAPSEERFRKALAPINEQLAAAAA
jgi:predicted Zn-dependent peptidase